MNGLSSASITSVSTATAPVATPAATVPEAAPIATVSEATPTTAVPEAELTTAVPEAEATVPNLPQRAVVFKAPHPVTAQGRRVFLAGSIEMGKAIDWQARLTASLAHLPITILNPRRDGWDPTWKQRKSNPQFWEQVKWELDQLDAADVIALYLQPGTISPITLLELGLHATSGKLVVCCGDEFHRKGNVEMMCERYNIPLIDGDIDEFIRVVTQKLETDESGFRSYIRSSLGFVRRCLVDIWEGTLQ